MYICTFSVVIACHEERRRVACGRLTAEHMRVDQSLKVWTGAVTIDMISSRCVAHAGMHAGVGGGITAS